MVTGSDSQDIDRFTDNFNKYPTHDWSGTFHEDNYSLIQIRRHQDMELKQSLSMGKSLKKKSIEKEKAIIIGVRNVDLLTIPEQRVFLRDFINLLEDEFPDKDVRLIIAANSFVPLSEAPQDFIVNIIRKDGLPNFKIVREQTFFQNIHTLLWDINRTDSKFTLFPDYAANKVTKSCRRAVNRSTATDPNENEILRT
jgi:hypothetical protein